MRRILLLTFALASLLCASAQEKASGWWNDNPSLVVPIREVGVTGVRPMKEIGVQKTVLDTLLLHENIALSMADVLTFHSSAFIKQYGRATLSTISFRGTGASHTQVLWNGMRINSPMLGMTDFSMIPSYFIDDATLLHGTSSVNTTGGGLGGAVILSTRPTAARGFSMSYTQGVGSYWTTDEFLRLTWGGDRWQGSTRVVYSSSPNEYKFRNRNIKENIYDDEKHIIGSYHPVQRHKDGDFHDLHILQELYCNTAAGDRFGLNAWYLYSDRGLSQILSDYSSPQNLIHEQHEETLRSVVSWDRLRPAFRIGVKAGYIHTWLTYDYARDLGNGNMAGTIRTRSRIHTLFASADGEYYLGERWLFTGNISLHQHFGEYLSLTKEGYDQARIELSGLASVKWTPTERLGLSVSLREELYGDAWTPLIPAFFADWLLSRQGNVRIKGSVSRNYRYPTLNDLYFQPGGNPDLKPEHGFTYDCGIAFAVSRAGRYSLHGEATWFDSYIDDWIQWVPWRGNMSYWTPENVKRVHAYGVELKAGLDRMLGRDWQLGLDGNFSWTPSLNEGDPVSAGDRSVGKQLIYVPEYSASVTGRLAFRSWRLLYKWCYYSTRYAMSSNTNSVSSALVPPYFMSDVTIEKLFGVRWADFSAKVAIRNLFNEEYLSVLERPMPRLNFEVFLEIRPRFGHRKR